MYLSEAVEEVVLVVSDDGVGEVVHSTEISALARASEVCLERTSARVLHTDDVSVIRPHTLEQSLKLQLLIHRLRCSQDGQPLQERKT